MTNGDSNPPGLLNLARKAAQTGLDALHNRGELFLVELQEEKNRVVELMIWIAIVCFLGIMFVGVLTATVILLFPTEQRLYASAGFCVLYLTGAILALLNLRAMVMKASLPFSDTINEVKKDREWLDSLK
jgi:uncharacterized membrane protein YqjE